VGLGVSRTIHCHNQIHQRRSFLKWAVVRWSVEHQELDLFPEITFIVTAHDAHGTLELLPPDPKLAIQWLKRQSGGKPVRSIKPISLARQKLFAIPIGPDPVQQPLPAAVEAAELLVATADHKGVPTFSSLRKERSSGFKNGLPERVRRLFTQLLTQFEKWRCPIRYNYSRCNLS
jgi:hypothetical protein